MKRYDAVKRINGYMQDGIHTVEVDLQDEDYKGVVVVQVSGRVAGSDVLDHVLLLCICDGDYVVDFNFEQNRKHVDSVDHNGYPNDYALYNANGDKLLISSVDIREHVTAIRIVKWEPRNA